VDHSARVGVRGCNSNIRSGSREEIVEVLDALEAAHKRAMDLTFDVLTTPSAGLSALTVGET
jgi:hypothetical protein